MSFETPVRLKSLFLRAAASELTSVTVSAHAHPFMTTVYCSSCLMLLYQCGSKSLRNASNSLLNRSHQESTQFWNRKEVQPGTSKFIYECMYASLSWEQVRRVTVTLNCESNDKIGTTVLKVSLFPLVSLLFRDFIQQSISMSHTHLTLISYTLLIYQQNAHTHTHTHTKSSVVIR